MIKIEEVVALKAKVLPNRGHKLTCKLNKVIYLNVSTIGNSSVRT